MIKKICLFAAAFLLFMPQIEAQEEKRYENNQPVFIDFVMTGKARNMFTIMADPFSSRLKQYDGSPYLHQDFRPGMLVLNDSTKADDLLIRYNVYAQQFEIKIDGKLYGMSKNEIVDYIRIGIQKFVFVEAKNNLQVFEQLNQQGHTRLLLKHACTFEPANYIAALDAGHEVPYFEHRNNYYIQSGDEEPQELKLRRKKVVEALGMKESEIENYIKENNLSTRDRGDLIRIFNHFNDII